MVYIWAANAMERPSQKISALDTTSPPDDRNKDGKICKNCIQLQGCIASTNSEQPGTSLLTSLNTVKDFNLTKCETSSANSKLPCTSNCNTKDASSTLRNYGYSNSYITGCSSTDKDINQKGKRSYKFVAQGHDSRTEYQDSEFEDRGLLELSSREHSRSFHEVKHLSSYQNGDLCRRLTHQMGNVSSNHQPQYPYSSSFHKFFLGQPTDQKHVPCANRDHFTTSSDWCENSSTQTDQIRDGQAYSGGMVSDSAVNRDSLHNQLYSNNIEREGPELSHCGINLRDLLVSRRSNLNRDDILCLFKQIVQIVDNAHCQEIALLELWPSSFILFESGNVKYLGSFLEIGLLNTNQGNKKRRSLEPELSVHDISARSQAHEASCHFGPNIVELKNSHPSEFESASTSMHWLTSENSQLEKKWYACPKGSDVAELLPLNIYSLGLMLFEFLCSFESMESHSAAMMDLHRLILPPSFLSKCPKEAGFCFWLLHPDPSSRPTTREILQSELLDGYEITSPSNDEALHADRVDDPESDHLLHFLVSLRQHMQSRVSDLTKSIEFVDKDIKEVEQRYSCKKYYKDSRFYNSEHVPHPNKGTALWDKLLGNISQLENAYFCLRSPAQLNEKPDVDRSDKDVLSNRDNWSLVQTQHNTTKKPVDRVGAFFDGFCKFAWYTKFEVCGTLRSSDMLNKNNVICSLSFDREEEYIAAAGVSKKIKIFELSSLLNDNVDVQYPVLEMANKSKLSCICWNKYIKNYLASTDYDGLVQIWDTSTGHAFAKYKEHQTRAWSVDFSPIDPSKFASGSDDCSVRIWSADERNSIATIWNPSNICCVQFSPFSSHLLAFGSAGYKIYHYDLRHTRIPWCTLSGHRKAVTYVRHLDSETLVSASTDNTLKLWDLNKTCLEGLSSNACCLTLSGHANEKNFVGLAVSDGYIVCGSETNEVYAYYRSLPMPITSHKFGNTEYPETMDHELKSNGGNGHHFVSSICWRKKSEMIAAANSGGRIEILRLA